MSRNALGILEGAQSPHETDLLYLSEQTGDPDLQFARSKDLALQVDLTNMIRAYKPENWTYIGDTVAPRTPVTSKSGRYKTLGQEGWDIDLSDFLSDEGEPTSLAFAVGNVAYYIDPHGMKTFVSDEAMDENIPINAATIAVKRLQQACLLRQEIRIRNLADATTNTITPGTDWDTSATIHTDVAAAQEIIQPALGQRANIIALGDHVMDQVVGNANMISSIAAAMAATDGRKLPGVATGSGVAEVTKRWGMRVILPNAFYNTAAPGLARVKARVWGDDGFMFYVDNETFTSTWAVQFELLKETIVRWRDEMRGTGGWWYKIIYKRVAKEITPEAIVKLIDLT